MEIKNLFTEEDFKMLFEALEFYPHKNVAGNMAMDLLGLVSAESKGAKEEVVRQRKIREQKQEHERQQLTEDARVLQGKIIQFKRWLISQDALDQVNKML